MSKVGLMKVKDVDVVGIAYQYKFVYEQLLWKNIILDKLGT